MSSKRVPFLASFIPGIALLLSPAMVPPAAAQGAICMYWNDMYAWCDEAYFECGCQWCWDTYGDDYNEWCSNGEGDTYQYALCFSE
jgi:hypothetical protein